MRSQTAGWYPRLFRWAAQRLYHELAWSYDLVSWLVSMGEWSARRRMALDHIVGQRVLEVGFGTGDLLGEMARRRIAAYGLELSPAMQRVASRKLRRAGLWVPRVRGDCRRMPFAAHAFDTLIATFPAEYILDPATLGEAARVLRAAGRFIIVDGAAFPSWPLLRPRLRAADTPLQRLLAGYRRVAAAGGFSLEVAAWHGGWLPAAVMVLQKEKPAETRAMEPQGRE